MKPDHPIYGKSENLKPGLYLALFHGRNSPDEELEDWGFNGPIIGPLRYVHTTYAHHIKFEFDSVEDHDRYFDHKEVGWSMAETLFKITGELFVQDDLVECDGKFYGDWTVYVEPVTAH